MWRYGWTRNWSCRVKWGSAAYHAVVLFTTQQLLVLAGSKTKPDPLCGFTNDRRRKVGLLSRVRPPARARIDRCVRRMCTTCARAQSGRARTARARDRRAGRSGMLVHVIVTCTSRDSVSPRPYERASIHFPVMWDGAEINIHASYRFEVATRVSEGCFAERKSANTFGSVTRWPITEPRSP
jgi:hypothetical protein